MTTRAYRCYCCNTCSVDGFATSEGLPLCTGCGDYAETYYLCGCGEHECADGLDTCISCFADICLETPSQLSGCHESLKDAVTQEFARRLINCGQQTTNKAA